MDKTEFRTKRMRAAKARTFLERGKHNKAKTDTIASVVMGNMFNPQLNQGRACNRYEYTKLL